MKKMSEREREREIKRNENAQRDKVEIIHECTSMNYLCVNGYFHASCR